MGNYQQPDYRIPTSLGTVQPHQPGAATGNPLAISSIPKYVQAGTSAPAAPIAGQLDNTPLGKSKKTFPDGSTSST